VTTGYEFGKTFRSSRQRMFIDQAFSLYGLENPGKKIKNGLKKPKPKQLILYLKLFGRESSSVFP